MSSLKDKAIKWLGGFTATEVEEIKADDLHRETYVAYKQLNIARLCSESWSWYEEIPEHVMRHVLVEGLTGQIEKYLNIETSTDGQKKFFRAEIEVVVKGGGVDEKN